jgi:hypothetical protein
VTVAPFDNPDIVQVHQPKGVDSPFSAAPGAKVCEKFVNVPALVETAIVPCAVTTLQLAPLQVVVGVLLPLLELPALLQAASVSIAPSNNATPPIRRSTSGFIALRSLGSSDRRQRRLSMRVIRTPPATRD